MSEDDREALVMERAAEEYERYVTAGRARVRTARRFLGSDIRAFFMRAIPRARPPFCVKSK
jgi:hypothetical protein